MGHLLVVADVRGGSDPKNLFTEDEEERDARDDFPRDELIKVTKGQKIEELLKEGQEVLVQVAKEPISTKGARITSYVSLPGRHLVFMPTVDHIGISRRIGTDKERKRLRDIVETQKPKGAGFIVRTVAEGASEKELRDDMDFLMKLWREVVRKNERAKPASLLYSDLDLVLRTVRDTLTHDVEKLIVDSRPEFERVQKFVQAFMPEFHGRIELYEGHEPIFDGFGIEGEVDRALERKVWLKSGGSLIIDQGEALTAIDVNTGLFVVDFIDMDKEANREKVWKAFNEALKPDRARANVTKISELGLVEMTRKRTRESLARKLTEPCFYCEGKGYLKSKTTICYEILRELRRSGESVKEDTIVVQCHPEIADLLMTSDHEYVEDMEKRLQKRVLVKPRASYHMEEYEILGRKAAEKRTDGKRKREEREEREERQEVEELKEQLKEDLKEENAEGDQEA